MTNILHNSNWLKPGSGTRVSYYRHRIVRLTYKISAILQSRFLLKRKTSRLLRLVVYTLMRV